MNFCLIFSYLPIEYIPNSFFGCLVVVGVAMLIVEINLFDLGFVYVFFFLSTMVNHH